MEVLNNVKLLTDERGYFVCFQDLQMVEFRSLQELIENNQSNLEWDFVNETIDDIPNA